MGELGLVCGLWGAWCFKGLERRRWEEVIVGGVRCCWGILEVVWSEGGLLLREELVGLQELHIENCILL